MLKFILSKKSTFYVTPKGTSNFDYPLYRTERPLEKSIPLPIVIQSRGRTYSNIQEI